MRDRRLPLAAHAVIVAVLLSGAALWVHATGSVSVDEGVAVRQAKTLADDGSWALPHPLSSVDPDGSAFPLRHVARTTDGFVPFAKHPLYPQVLSWADRAGGVAGMIGLSVAGTVAAALAAAALARRLDPRLPVPAFYVVALGSPLLFDSNLVIAHTLGAAAAGGTAVALVRHHESGAGWWSPWLPPAVVGIVASVLLRGEGLLLVAALILVAAAVGLARRSSAWLTTAAVALIAGGGAVAVDRWWRARILGTILPISQPPTSAGSWIGDRLSGLGRTTVAVEGSGGAPVLLVLTAALLLAVLLAVRRGGDDEPAARFLAVGAGASAVAWALVAPRDPVSGILVAFPLLWFGLAAGRWTTDPLARALVAVSGVFALAVAATQYAQGGGFEWGARYLHLALPLVVPVALLGLLRGAEAVASPRTARVIGGGLAVVMLSLGAVALSTERDLGTGARTFGAEIVDLAPTSHLGASDGDRRPIVVTTSFLIPQLTWQVYDDARWLRLRDDGPVVVDGIDGRVQALLDAGVDRFTFVTEDLARDRPLLGDAVVLAPHVVHGWSVVVVEPNMRSQVATAR